MKRQKLKILVAVCVMCISTTFLSTVAHADTDIDDEFTVCIDTSGGNDEGIPSWAGSNSDVLIEAQIGSTWITVADEIHPNIHEWWNMPALSGLLCYDYDGYTYDDVSAVRVSIDGTDGLFMDRIILAGDPVFPQSAPYWSKTRIWGVNNYKGYCLSEEEEGAAARAYCSGGRFWTMIGLWK